MGTGIVATAAADLPVPWPGLRRFAAAVWVLSAVWLITPAGAEVPLYAAPARADVKDLAGPPPAWVSAYQFDVTRDEVLNYARPLIQAGVPCDLQHYGTAFHLAHQFPGTAIGERMINDRMQAIRRLLPLQKACHG
jgi:acetyl esterase